MALNRSSLSVILILSSNFDERSLFMALVWDWLLICLYLGSLLWRESIACHSVPFYIPKPISSELLYNIDRRIISIHPNWVSEKSMNFTVMLFTFHTNYMSKNGVFQWYDESFRASHGLVMSSSLNWRHWREIYYYVYQITYDSC